MLLLILVLNILRLDELRVSIVSSFHSRAADGKKELKYSCEFVCKI